MAFVLGEFVTAVGRPQLTRLASPTSLARDTWPEGKGRMIQDQTTLASLPPHRRVPATYEDMCGWLCVDPCGADSSSSVWIHPDVVGDEVRVELSVRLQGFVEEVSIGMLGNWSG